MMMATSKCQRVSKYDLNDMARDAIGLMDYLEINKAHIVGASMGGMITQVIGLDYPDRVLSLTPIMSSPGVGDNSLSGVAPSLVWKRCFSSIFKANSWMVS